MHRWVYAAIGLLVCAGVPVLILVSAQVFAQVPGAGNASRVCVSTGGVNITVNGGGYCRFRDGRLVDARLLFDRGQGRAVMPNPASVNCGRYGGRVEVVNGPGGQTGYCHLPNGAIVEEWALFHGR